MWLIHVVKCSPWKGLHPRSKGISSFFLPSTVQQKGSPSTIWVRPCSEGHLRVENEEKSLRRFNPCVLPSRTHQELPRGSTRRQQCFTQLGRNNSHQFLVSSHPLQGSLSGTRLSASLAPSDSKQPQSQFVFHSAPFLPPSVVLQAAFHQPVAAHAFAHPGNHGRQTARILREKQ